MSKLVRKRLFGDVQNLEMNNKKLSAIVSGIGRGQVMEILKECQSIAIGMGECIEAVYGTDTKSVQYLERYCEQIYQLSLETDVKHYATCKKILTEIKTIMEQELPDRREVVFFPYKASMWDALESVWMSAVKDENCDPYVVPIPYFDRKPELTNVIMHYEGNDFPEYVPVTDWKSYDVKMRLPDAIYIHNPYDNINKVTTVHMDYYARELKKYTNMLVYIPYFVGMNDRIPANLCVLPGTMYADRVVVQSERAREVYIREFHKFEEEFKCSGKFGIAEEKFIALGSPKYDKVMQKTKRNLEIPKDWKDKILNRDGAFKKILLYNTSLVQLLQGGEKTLEKIQSVFDLLKLQDDLVLLWRPHPLSESTVSSMRPQLKEKYDKMVQDYKRENWGIYDDTADLHRAIALSDAYYGDGSSLVDLYRITGKPIMIQDIETI